MRLVATTVLDTIGPVVLGMGVPRGRQKHTICLKNVPKHTIFFQKIQKTYYFGRAKGGGGKNPFLPSPAVVLL